MNNDNLEILGTEELIKKFTELTGREQTKAKNTALKKGSDILVKAARQSLRTVTKGYNRPNWWNGKTLESGIKYSKPSKDSDTAKVHILADFRLKFWELGTQLRRTKAGASRGVHKRHSFSNPLYRLRCQKLRTLWVGYFLSLLIRYGIRSNGEFRIR